KNGPELVERIKRETGIVIEVIDGEHEAAIIAMTDLHQLIKNDKNYLYVDVGGGSTEFTVFSNGKSVASRSFKLGTVRILNDLVKEETWQDAAAWVKEKTKRFHSIRMIGSGGNINHIFKQSDRKRGKPLTFFYLSSFYQLI